MAQVNASPAVALRILTHAWPKAARGDAKAVHETRVASRRLREALRLLDHPRRESRRLARDLKHVTRMLGPVRELDVSRALLMNLAKAEPWLAAAIERLDVRLLEVSTVRRGRLAREMARLDEKDLFERIGHVMKRAHAGRRVSLDDRARIAERIAGRAAEARAAADSAGALYAAEALHDARIKTKKLRYALEVGRAARMAGAGQAATSLRRYQDLLGDLHDHQVLAEHAARLQSRLPMEDDDLGALSDLLAYLETQNRKLHAEFVSRRDSLVALDDHHANNFTRATQTYRA